MQIRFKAENLKSAADGTANFRLCYYKDGGTDLAYETTYNIDAIGDNGNSFGLLQVQPRWHYSRMERLGCTDLLDPFQNVTVAVDYLAEQIENYGSLEKGLVAYNKGHYAGTMTSYANCVLAKATEIAHTQYEVEA